MSWVYRAPALAYGVIIAFFLLWSWGLGKVPLFDWDEVNFAECAREMRVSGIYWYAQVGFLPFWEKPPLFFWLQALSMEVWGENALGARFPNALITALTLLTLYELGRRWHHAGFGLAWMLLYGVSLLPSFYARSGLIDPLFNLLMLWALVGGIWALEKNKPWQGGLFFGTLTAFATLTKGPVGLVLPALGVGSVGILQRRWRTLLWMVPPVLFAYFLLIGAWVIQLYRSDTVAIVKDFWAYQWRLFSTSDAGHAGPWYYHLMVLIVGMFPAAWWALGLRAFRRLPISAQGLLILTFWTILIFSIVKTKILHYSSLAYFGIAYAGAWVWSFRRMWIRRWGWLLWGSGAMLLGLLTIAAGFFMTQVDYWLPWVKDPFARSAIEYHPVIWTGWEGWSGFLLLGGVGVALLLRLSRLSRFFLMSSLLAAWETVTLWSFAPRVEAYSQAPLRRFCEAAAQEGTLVWSLGFKSYIPFFYGRMHPDLSPRLTGSLESFQSALLSGEVPATIYFVSRIERYQLFVEAYPLEVIGKEGGYVFLRLSGGASQAKRK